ncbi:MAG TPA: hypothetical protein VLZ89_02910 [Anaerolineales bacterium]|nr:hypothetical protein [Anaerolineales bacterium]
MNANRPGDLSEDKLKLLLKAWLEAQGWQSAATKAATRWIIEVKGIGSRNAMRVNCFLGILGETLQRMNNPQQNTVLRFPTFRNSMAFGSGCPNWQNQERELPHCSLIMKGKFENHRESNTAPTGACAGWAIALVCSSSAYFRATI